MKRNSLGQAFRPPRASGVWMAVLAALLLAALSVPVSAALISETFESGQGSWAMYAGSWLTDSSPSPTGYGLSYHIPDGAISQTHLAFDAGTNARVKCSFSFYTTQGAVDSANSTGKYNRWTVGVTNGTGGAWSGSAMNRLGLMNSPTYRLMYGGGTAFQDLGVGLSVGWHTASFVADKNAGTTSWHIDSSYGLVNTGITTQPNRGIVGYNYSNGSTTLDAFDSSVWIDNYTVEAFGAAPAKATNPNPADLGLEVPLNGATLSWQAGAGSVGTETYDVYLGTNSAALTKVSSLQAAKSYAVSGTLTASAQYYWRVDTIDAVGSVVAGDVWRFFTTGPGGVLTPTATPAAGGTVSPPGKYTLNQVVPLTATANWGYMFKKWSNFADGSDTVSWNASFNYTMPNETDHAIYAIFVPVNDVIVESRDTGKNHNWYTDVAADSGVSCLAPGCIATGTRYISCGQGATKYAKYAPVLTPGTYNVYVAWAKSTNGGKKITHEVHYANGGVFKTLFNQNQNVTAGEDPAGGLYDQWNSLGKFDFAGDGSGYVMQYSDPAYGEPNTLRVMPAAANWRFVPPKAITPSPSDGQPHIPLTGATLTWSTPQPVVAYDVYFGTNPASLTKVSTHRVFDADGRTFDTGPLTQGTTYYWRVDSVDATTTTGDVWSFSGDGPPGTGYLWLKPNPAGNGTVSGNGYYTPGTIVHITATPATNYDFAKWTSDQAGNTVVSTSPAYDYTMPSGDSTLYAQFVGHPYNVTLVAVPAAGGSPTGGGSKPFGSTVTVNAAPNEGYFFLNWTDSTGAVKSRKASYSFTMPGNALTLNANYVKAVFAEGFEGLEAGSLDMNDPTGPNRAANSDLTSAQPWWGTQPPCGSVGTGFAPAPHSGTNANTGITGFGHDYVNLAYRYNQGSKFIDNVYCDWWFYDPCGTAFDPNTWQGYCNDPLSLVHAPNLIPESSDYAEGSTSRFTDADFDLKLSLGMCDVWTGATAAPFTPYANFDPSKYQARMIADGAGIAATGPGTPPAPFDNNQSWYNLNITRSVGWHHARIILGPLVDFTSTAKFYIDDMSTPLLTGEMPWRGVNAIELSTEWKNGGTTDTTVHYPKATTYDDIVFGNLPSGLPTAPVAAAASNISDVSIKWNWTESDTVDGFNVYDAASAGALKGSVATNNFAETGLTSNKVYNRWVVSYFGAGPNAPYASFESARTALAAATTLAAIPSATNITTSANSTAAYNATSWPGFTNPQGFGTDGKVSKFKYKWSTSASDSIAEGAGTDWTTGSLMTMPSTDGTYYLYVRSYNSAGVGNGSTKLGPYTFDTQAPTNCSVVINSGAATTTSANVTLTLAATGATQMAFSNDNVTYSAPEAYATTKSWTLSAGGGLKTVYAKFIDAASNATIVSDTITYEDATPVAKISDLWPLTNGPSYKLTDKVVTGVVGNAFWIEETNRSAAIKVVYTGAMPVQGNKVDVSGVLDSSSGQRVLNATSWTDKGAGTAIAPLGVIERAAGGKGVNANTPAISGGTGLYNVGMLVRIAGSAGNSSVSDPNNKYFYLDDGSGLVDGAIPGIKVLCGTNAPKTSGNVTVTGLVGVVGGKPVIIIRGAGDIL